MAQLTDGLLSQGPEEDRLAKVVVVAGNLHLCLFALVLLLVVVFSALRLATDTDAAVTVNLLLLFDRQGPSGARDHDVLDRLALIRPGVEQLSAQGHRDVLLRQESDVLDLPQSIETCVPELQPLSRMTIPRWSN